MLNCDYSPLGRLIAIQAAHRAPGDQQVGNSRPEADTKRRHQFGRDTYDGAYHRVVQPREPYS